MAFTTFKDFDKDVKDALNDDFDLKHSIKIKSKGPFGVGFTTTSTFDAKEHKLSGKLGLKWAHSSGFTLEKLEIAPDGKTTTETSLVGVAPNLKLEFKGNDTDKGDLSVTYKHALATVTGEVDGISFSRANASVNAGFGKFTAGASADVKLAKSAVQSVNVDVGAGASFPNFFFGLRANKKFSEFLGTFSYVAAANITLAGQVNYAKGSASTTLGAIYKCNPDTTIKVKANSVGVINASVKQSVDKSFSVVGAAEIPAGFSGFKFGVNATLG